MTGVDVRHTQSIIIHRLVAEGVESAKIYCKFSVVISVWIVRPLLQESSVS